MIPKSLNKYKDTIYHLIHWYSNSCLPFIKKYGKFPLQISELSTINTLLKIFDTFIDQYREDSSKVSKDAEEYLSNCVLFSVVWSIGAILEEISRPKFHEFLYGLINGSNVIDKFNLETVFNFEPKAMNYKLNDAKNIYELCFDKNKNLWINWMQTVPAFKIPKGIEFHELIVPTIDSTRNNFFLNLSITNL